MPKDYDLSFLDEPSVTTEKDYDLSFLDDDSQKLEADLKAQDKAKKDAEQAQIAQAQQAAEQAADPANWSLEQTKKHYKDNPPQNMEEGAKAQAAIKMKKDQEKTITDDLMADQKKEQGKQEFYQTIEAQGADPEAVTPQQYEGPIGVASPEDIKKWREKGPIIWSETAKRLDKTEMLPFNPEGAFKSLELLAAAHRLRDADKGKEGVYPHTVVIPMGKFSQHKVETTREDDEKRIRDYLMKVEEEQVRGKSIGGHIVTGAAELPAYMIEFITTGGLASFGKKAVGKVAGKVAEKGAKRAALRAVKWTAGGLARTIAMPHKVAEQYAARQLPDMTVDEQDKIVMEAVNESPFTSAWKAYGDVVIENMSEEAGAVLAKGAGKVVKKVVPAKMAKAIREAFKKLHPGEKISKLFKQAGYHGFLEEMGEERLGDLMRAVTGVQDFGAEDGNVFDRIVASIPNGEQILIEAGVLAIPGAARVAAGAVKKVIDKKTGEPKAEPVKEEKKPEVEKEEKKPEEDKEILSIETELAKLEERIKGAKGRVKEAMLDQAAFLKEVIRQKKMEKEEPEEEPEKKPEPTKRPPEKTIDEIDFVGGVGMSVDLDDSGKPLSSDAVKPRDVKEGHFDSDFRNKKGTPLKRDKLEQKRSAIQEDLEEDIEMYNDLLKRGSKALSTYDVTISSDSAESGVRTALSLKQAHISYNKAKLSAIAKLLGEEKKPEPKKEEKAKIQLQEGPEKYVPADNLRKSDTGKGFSYRYIGTDNYSPAYSKKLALKLAEAHKKEVEEQISKGEVKIVLPPHLQKIIDKEKGGKVDDVTPEGFGPGKAEPKPDKGPRKVGTGEILTSKSGRKLAPVPKIDLSTDGKSRNSIKRMEAWLVSEARKEATATKDDFNYTQFKGMNPARLSQSDKDSLNLYLFDNVLGPVAEEKAHYEYRPIVGEDYNIKRKEYKLPYKAEDLEKAMHPDITKNINKVKKEIFDKTGLHLTITNAFRTKEYNEVLADEIGDDVDEDSEHMRGNAIDVVFRASKDTKLNRDSGDNIDWDLLEEDEQTEILKAVKAAGLVAMDNYEQHLHIEAKPGRAFKLPFETRLKEKLTDKQTVGKLFDKQEGVQESRRPEEPTTVLYHGTTPANAQSILKSGFKKGSKVSLTSDYSEALGYTAGIGIDDHGKERPKGVIAVRVKPGAINQGIDGVDKLTGEDLYDPADIEVVGIREQEEEIEELSSRSWSVESKKEPETRKKINKTQIIKWVEKAFKVPIRGRATRRGFGKKGKKAGHYEVRAELIRLKTFGELPVIAHEVAHHIDEVLERDLGLERQKLMGQQMKRALGKGWRGPTDPTGIFNQIREELANLDYNPKARRTSEGFAEYMRYYLTTDTAAEKAPVFHKWFTETFLTKHKEFAKNLATLKSMVDTWYKQGAENRILQQVDFKGEHTKETGISNALHKARDWVLKNFHDEFYMIKKVEEQVEARLGHKLSPSESPYSLATYSKSKSGVIARTMVMEKMIDEEGKVLGPGLREILAPIPSNQMSSFLSYAIARRARLTNSRGKESGFDQEDIEYILKKYQNPEWDKISDELTAWSDHLVGWLVRAGNLGPAEAELIRKLNPIYLPFKRAFIDKIEVIKGAGGFVNKGQPLKTMKGSGRPIINPIESMIAQATELIQKAQKARVARSIADMAKIAGVGGFIVKVPAPQKVTKFPIVEAIKQLYQNNLVDIPEDVAKAINEAEEGGLDGFLTLFGVDSQYKGKDNIVTIWRDGEREFYELHPDLYQSLMGIDLVKRGTIMKLLGPPARMLRLGATSLRVSFGLARNPFRDAFTYAIFSKRKSATVFDPIKGIYVDLTTKPGETPWRFKAVGGQLAGQMGFDRASTMATYDDLLFAKLNPLGKSLHVVKHPFNALWRVMNVTRDALSVTEMAPRVLEVQNLYEHYKKTRSDWTEEDAFIQAFNDAQDVTVNFSKSGYMAKRINEVAAFFNVAIRGPEKVYRSLKERPVATIVKGFAWITMLALGNWFKNKDEEWYRNLPPAYKYNNFFFAVGDVIIRLPIPFDLGIIFASMPMAMLDYLETKDPQYLKGLEQLIVAQVPDPMPTAFGPMIDVGKNRDWLDRPIESEGMQYLYPTERKRQHTTQMASALSKGFDHLGIALSPVQLDYLINSYTGGWARQLPLTPTKEAADIPVLGDLLLRMPERPQRQLNTFFGDWEVLSARKQSDIASKAELTKYNRIKPLYNLLTRGYFKQMKRARKDGQTDRVKALYKKIGTTLERYGYE